MEREDQTIGLVELGVASVETQGALVGRDPETIGFYPLGISAD